MYLIKQCLVESSMFLVQDSNLSREARIKQFLAEDPALSALLSVIHFEWTIRRAIIVLGNSSNVKVRAKLKNCHGLDKYKDVWKEEVSEKKILKNFPQDLLRLLPKQDLPRLPEVAKDWQGLDRAFRLRHRLVHGATSCGAEYASDRVYWAINATNDVRTFCLEQGIDLDLRLPVRRGDRS